MNFSSIPKMGNFTTGADCWRLPKPSSITISTGTKEGEASVNIYRNHIKIIGHLGNAYDESTDFIELHELLKEAERNYRYEGIAPKWEALFKEMERVKSQQINKKFKK